jgi:hypothetical protein
MSRRNIIARLVRMTPRMRSLSPYLSTRKLGRVFHTLLPSIVALSLTAAAHAQGTMDFSGATTLMTTFKTVLGILQKAGGWRPSLYLKIENPPYMALVIEAVDESGPSGLPSISVAHYGEQNGDLMRDPEMCLELVNAEELNPFYWRNDYVAIEQWSRNIVRGQYVCLTALHEQHVLFAETWDNNLRLQGFSAVFSDKCILG